MDSMDTKVTVFVNGNIACLEGKYCNSAGCSTPAFSNVSLNNGNMDVNIAFNTS